jgi:curved DNA-binding protein CbpA
MAARDHYEVLGVRRDAPPEEIKSAFKKLASQNHPDRNQDDPAAHERFKEVALAYQVLSDPNRRGMYDRFGHRAEEPGSPFGSSGPFPGGFVDISDIAIDGILGDLLGVFGVGRGDKGDIKRELELTFEEAAFGCEKSLRYDRVIACTTATGIGRRRRHDARGVRRVQRSRAREIPAGHLPHRRREDLLEMPRHRSHREDAVQRMPRQRPDVDVGVSEGDPPRGRRRGGDEARLGGREQAAP